MAQESSKHSRNVTMTRTAFGVALCLSVCCGAAGHFLIVEALAEIAYQREQRYPHQEEESLPEVSSPKLSLSSSWKSGELVLDLAVIPPDGETIQDVIITSVKVEGLSPELVFPASLGKVSANEPCEISIPVSAYGGKGGLNIEVHIAYSWMHASQGRLSTMSTMAVWLPRKKS